MKISDFSLRHCLRITEIIIANNPGKCKGQDDNNYNIASPPLSFVRSGFVILDYGSLRYFGINGYGWSSASRAFTRRTARPIVGTVSPSAAAFLPKCLEYRKLAFIKQFTFLKNVNCGVCGNTGPNLKSPP